MWYVSSNRDETRYEDPDRFDVRRNPEHQAFGAGGRHFCLGTALARLELRILFEETLKRYPAHAASRGRGAVNTWNRPSSTSSSCSPSGSRHNTAGQASPRPRARGPHAGGPRRSLRARRVGHAGPRSRARSLARISSMRVRALHQHRRVEELNDRFSVPFSGDAGTRRFNIAPTEEVLAIVARKASRKRACCAGGSSRRGQGPQGRGRR